MKPGPRHPGSEQEPYNVTDTTPTSTKRTTTQAPSPNTMTDGAT